MVLQHTEIKEASQEMALIIIQDTPGHISFRLRIKVYKFMRYARQASSGNRREITK